MPKHCRKIQTQSQTHTHILHTRVGGKQGLLVYLGPLSPKLGAIVSCCETRPGASSFISSVPVFLVVFLGGSFNFFLHPLCDHHPEVVGRGEWESGNLALAVTGNIWPMKMI